MALPDLIEIVPLTQPVRAEITVPGSKSITNRALILAALADGETVLRGALWSEDTQIMVACLERLGFKVNVEPDANEFCNRTITVNGLGGKVPAGGPEAQPLDLFVGNAGTAARFLAPFLCLGSGAYRLHGVPRMHERPQAALFQALRELGYRVESENGNDKLPVRIFGAGPKKGKCRVSIESSSQFASALLLSAKHGGWEIEIAGENAEESPYVTMTRKLIAAFPQADGEFQIEPDASSGSYFWAANDLNSILKLLQKTDPKVHESSNLHDWDIQVKAWPEPDMQVDANFPGTLEVISISKKPEACEANAKGAAFMFSRKENLGDSIMTAIVIAPLAGMKCFFTDLGRLRVQECERVVALRTELTKCGAKIIEYFDTLTVYPSPLHGAEIETYHDHRMAMCFAVLGLKIPGIKIINPACVKKTFPNFFQKLAAAPPHGLGATILDARTGRKLTHEELFAD